MTAPSEDLLLSPNGAATRRPRYPAAVGKVLKDPVIRIAGSFIVIVVVAALLASVLPIQDPQVINYAAQRADPSADHWLGTDELGRDIFSRVIYGGRISMSVGLISVGVALVLGVPIGLIAGYRGGIIDTIVMRFVDVVISVPPLLMAIAIAATLGFGLRNTMIAIGLIATPAYARLIRAETLAARELDYVTAAKALGASSTRIMAFHVFPATVPALIVQSSLGLGFAILTEAALSVLGLGVQPPTPSWGGMLKNGYPYIATSPWIVVGPGLAIFLAVLAFNMIGDSLRDILDPRLRNRRSSL